MRTAVNRLLLGLTGLVLLALGLAVLAGALGHWPYDGPKDVLLSAEVRRRYRDQGWWWPTVIALLGAVVLGALWWLLAQLRDRRLRQIVINGGNKDGDSDSDGQGVVLRGRALEDVIAADTERLPGVARAHAALTGTRDAPSARLVLALAPRAHPGALLTELAAAVLEPARTSAGLAALPAEARLRAVRHRAERVT